MNWLLEHGLDGIGAGLVAVVGVAGTLAYDRKARRDDREHEREAEVRATINRIMVTAIDVGMLAKPRPPTRPRFVQEVATMERQLRLGLERLEREVRVAHATLLRVEPIGSDLIMLGVMANAVANRPPISRELTGRVADSAANRCQAWLMDPSTYDGSFHDRVETHVHGETVIQTISNASADVPEPPDPAT